MQRLNGDRGAVSVVTALLMVPLIAFVAISVDVAATYSDRQQLQSGADAAALAIAQDCARDDCRVPGLTAQVLSLANTADDGPTATVTDPALRASSGHVTVRNAGTTEHWFAPLIGVDETELVTYATARWGYPTGGTAVLPLTFSWCEFAAQTGGGVPSGTTERTILFTKTSGTGCTGPSGNVVPGGFGWLDVDPGTCHATSDIAAILWSSTGNSVPSGCSPASFDDLRGETVLLPIFDASGGTGNNAWYRVYGYAAFTITGYYFAGRYRWDSPCTGAQRCIRGYFTRFVSLSDAFTYDLVAPRLGASVVALSE
jgi:hypothetical protein